MSCYRRDFFAAFFFAGAFFLAAFLAGAFFAAFLAGAFFFAAFFEIVFILVGAKIVQLRAPFGVLIVEIPVIVQLLIVETELCFLKHFLSLLSSGHVHP